ncbi:MAG: chitin binding peritrophin-A domain-containing protein [Bdellovibrionota bacterium]
MKRFFGLLNLILCLELIIGPHFPGTRIFTSGIAKAETCPTGLVFDSTLNRCITSDQSALLINASASCNGDKECYKRLAEEQFKKAEEEGKIVEAVKNKGGLIGTVATVGAIAGPLTAVLGMVGKGKSASPSGIAMIAGGLAFFVGNIMSNKKHKSCLKKIKEEWEKNKAATTEQTSSGVSKVSMSQGQSEAFEMMAKSEDCMKSSAKMKAGFYAAATLAYAASGVLAITGQANPVEQTPLVPGPDVPLAPETTIVMTEPADPKVVAQVFYNIEKSETLTALLSNVATLNNLEKKSCNLFSESELMLDDFKQKDDSLNEIAVSYLKDIFRGIKSEFTFIQEAHANPLAGILAKAQTPTGRAVIAGVLAGLTAMMWMHANKQAKVAGQRAEFLRNLKKEFDESSGAISCTAEERGMSANANCYCYTEAGQRNQARANSEVCQKLFTGNTLAKAGDYNSLDFSNQKVCIASNGSADESCACKQTKSCLNAIPSMGGGNLGLGAISVASNGMKPLNDLVNGQIGSGSINGVGTLTAAARLLDKKNELAKKSKIDPNKTAKIAKDFQNAIVTAGAGTSSLSSTPTPLPMDMSPSQAAQALEKELGPERSFERVSGSPAVGQPGNATPGDESGFSLGTAEPVTPSEDAQLAEVMKQDLNYDQADITKSNSNLFQILSNRYQRSGMRRLFEEKEVPAPEAANKSDITQ